MRLSLALIIVAGCGSSWDLRKDESLGVGCEAATTFYVDEDGDDWGAPGQDSVQLCEAEEGFSTNAQDCDDSDPQNGGAASKCPSEISDDAIVWANGGREYLLLAGSFPAANGNSSERICRQWTGDTPGTVEDGGDPTVGLAVLDSATEVTAVLAKLDEVLAAGDVALHLGLEWQLDSEGGDLDAGSWIWVNGGTDGVAEMTCAGGLPVPYEMFSDQFVPGWENPSDSQNAGSGDSTVRDGIDTLRLPVVRSGGSWCLGESPDTYAQRHAHLLCERPLRDGTAYFGERKTSNAGGGDEE